MTFTCAIRAGRLSKPRPLNNRGREESGELHETTEALLVSGAAPHSGLNAPADLDCVDFVPAIDLAVALRAIIQESGGAPGLRRQFLHHLPDAGHRMHVGDVLVRLDWDGHHSRS